MVKEAAIVAIGLLALSSHCVIAQATNQHTAQETLAIVVGAASVAEKDCNLPGEAKRVKNWIDQSNSGFDLHNHSDLAAVLLAMNQAKKRQKEIGVHAWCIEYKVKLRPLFQSPL